MQDLAHDSFNAADAVSDCNPMCAQLAVIGKVQQVL